MNKTILIGDIHWGESKNSPQVMKMQFEYFTTFFKQKLIENGIKKVFINGDLIDNRKTMSIILQNMLIDVFGNHLKDFEFHVIVGNHDVAHKDSNEINGISFLDKILPNFNVYTEPTEMILENGKKVLLVPWLHEKSDFRSYVNQLKKEGKYFDFCFGHFELNGFKLNSKVVHDFGEQDVTMFQDVFGAVFSGHYHTRSSKDVFGVKFQYGGSPFAFNRSDIDDPKGFIHLNLDTSEYEFIESENIFRFHKIDFDTFEKKKTKLTAEFISKNFIDVYVKKSKVNTPSYKKFQDQIKSLFPQRYTTILIDDSVELVSALQVQEDALGLNIDDIIVNYVSKLDVTQILKDRITLEIGNIQQELKNI